MKKITLRDVPSYIRDKDLFQCNSSLYALEHNHLYAVYSYGDHFPIAVFDRLRSCWFVNRDKYSCTTSRHQAIVLGSIGSSAITVPCGYLRTYISAKGDLQKLVDYYAVDLRGAIEIAPIADKIQGFPLRESVAA